jgi:hypothetical protein
MKRTSILLLIVALLFLGYAEVTQAAATCSSLSSLSMQSGSASTGSTSVNGTRCYQLTGVSTTAAKLTLNLSVSGAVDVYWSAGNASTFSDRNKLNLGDFITQAATYVFRNPSARTYSIAVVSNGASTVGLTTATARSSSGTSSPTVCSGNICRSSHPLSSSDIGAVMIGSAFGDRIIFPFEAACPGRIQATATWSGSASNLALILNGESQVGYFARIDGSSPLFLSYDVSDGDVASGGRWQLSLVNFSGGEAQGDIEFSYPLCNNSDALPYGPYTCMYGYVWREAGPNDFVCVTGDVRQQAWDDNSQAQSRIDPNGAYGPNSCIQGYVWREAFPGDLVCVTGDVREQAWVDNSAAFERYVLNFPYGPDSCVSGYVWREAAFWDRVCVTGDVRQQAWDDNSQAHLRVDPNGAYGPNTCISGYVWREAFPGDLVCVTPDVREQARIDNAEAESRYLRNQ